MVTICYARLLRRVQAMGIDSIILMLAFFGSLVLASALGIEPGHIRAALAFGILLGLEPVLVAYTGGTIGQHIMNLRVRHEKLDKNINIFAATVRYASKMLLGVWSLVVVLTSRRHQAIHDLLSNSIVVVKYPQAVAAHELLAEREFRQPGYHYPSALRRILLIAIYLAVLLYALVGVGPFLYSAACLDYGECHVLESMGHVALSFVSLIAMVMIVVYGWRSQLWGARRRAIVSNPIDISSLDT